jgi:GTPase SAR1 family protein
MYSLVSGAYAQYFASQQLNLLLVGCQGSGKTALLERLKVTEFETKSSSSPSGRRRRRGRDGLAMIRPEPLRSRIFNKDAGPEDYRPRQRSVRNLAARQLHSPPPRRREQQPGAAATTTMTAAATATGQAARNKISFWVCPTPARYKKTDEEDDDDEYAMDTNGHETGDDDEDGGIFDDIMIDKRHSSEHHPRQQQTTTTTTEPSSLLRPSSLHASRKSSTTRRSSAPTSTTGPPGLPAPRRISVRQSTNTFASLESIDLEQDPDSTEFEETFHEDGDGDGDEEPTHSRNDRSIRGTTSLGDDVERSSSAPVATVAAAPPPRAPVSAPVERPRTTEYDAKPGARMLPLDRIRPTIGMNLAKVDVCGASVRVWDVGGRMRELWERYYADADAVVFVWKLQQRNSADEEEDGSDDDSSGGSSAGPPALTAEQQRTALEQVRARVADDVPLLVLGHLFQEIPPARCEPDVLYSTDELLPHYHNPCQGLHFGNAATGQGIKTALEWLIGLAKQQQHYRQQIGLDGIHPGKY